MRVTVDIDYAEPMDILIGWNRLASFDPGSIKGRLSSSGEGCHLVAYGVETSDPKALMERRICGDDPWRLELDIIKYWRPSQVLFESPYPWVDCPFNLIDQLLTGVSYEV